MLEPCFVFPLELAYSATFHVMETRAKQPSPDVIAHNAAKYTLVTGESSTRPTSQIVEQSSPVKANGKKTKGKEAKATSGSTAPPGHETKRSSRNNLAVVLRGGSKPDGQVDDPVSLRQENKRLTEENTLLRAEVEYWHAKAKERHAKCLKLKAVIQTVQDNMEGPSDDEDSADDVRPKAKALLQSEPTPTKPGREPDFTKATITWSERDPPKSRFDENARAKLVPMLIPHHALASLSLAQSTRRPEPVIHPSPLKGTIRRDQAGSPTKNASHVKHLHSLGRSVSPTKPQSSPSKPRWN